MRKPSQGTPHALLCKIRHTKKIIIYFHFLRHALKKASHGKGGNLYLQLHISKACQKVTFAYTKVSAFFAKHTVNLDIMILQGQTRQNSSRCCFCAPLQEFLPACFSSSKSAEKVGALMSPCLNSSGLFMLSGVIISNTISTATSSSNAIHCMYLVSACIMPL